MSSGHDFIRLIVVLLTFGAAVILAATDDHLLTPDEIARIDRENALWHEVHADADLASNLNHLRANGATAAELAWFEPELAAQWDVPLHREFGWMHPEQIESIKAVDAAFITRLRAARVRRDVGIELDPGHRGETVLAVYAGWARALRRVLDYDQIAEFRLMNSPSAERAARFFENIPLGDDERRTVYQWQREYDGLVIPFTQNSTTRRYDLDHWTRLRDLLGDERMAIYLAAAAPEFARLQDSLGPEVSPATALDVWWILQERRLEKPPGFASGETLATQTERFRTRLRKRLGEKEWARYLASPGGRWLAHPEVISP